MISYKMISIVHISMKIIIIRKTFYLGVGPANSGLT